MNQAVIALLHLGAVVHAQPPKVLTSRPLRPVWPSNSRRKSL